ncbi:MAG: AMP-binding protein [Deltaproteobacteria bacterium]|nr:AMP-binding protein [Deltaproteobacteria bacterium]
MPDFENIAAYLPEMAKKQPHRPAVNFPAGRDKNGRVKYTHYTFSQLDRESDWIARGLEQSGIGRGVRATLMVKPSLEFFALTFAIFKAGAVPVLIDPGIGIGNLKKCLAQAEPEAFIGIPEAHAARLMLGWGRKTIRTLITVGKRFFWKGLTLKEVRTIGRSAALSPMAQTAKDEIAAILFTSGSTGPPRGALYTHGNFTAQVESIRKTYGIEPGEIDLPTFPLFALFGPALGMAVVIPDMDPTRPANVDPRKIIEAIRDFGITNMFGSPALINRVGRYGHKRGIKLPTIRRVIAAGAPMPPAVLERFCTMLESNAQVHTGYGATEAMPVSSIGSREILRDTRYGTDRGKGVCVGKPVDGMAICVVPISDDAIGKWHDSLKLPPGEVGEITVKGPVATGSYYKDDRGTRLTKIYERGGKGFWHRMGDLGTLDEKGRLWFFGRKSHRVVTPSGTYFTIPCEGVFNTHKAVFRTALTGVKRDGNVHPVLCVELEDQSKNVHKDAVRTELLELGARFPHTKEVKTILFHDGFPVDIRHNAKIYRERLGVWATKKLAEERKRKKP